MNNLKGFRTVILNVIAVVGMVITMATGIDTQGDVLVMQEHTAILIESLAVLWGLAGIWLRYVTDTPIFHGRQNATTKRK